MGKRLIGHFMFAMVAGALCVALSWLTDSPLVMAGAGFVLGAQAQYWFPAPDTRDG